ncbi:MAG: hypothetical protein H0T46_11115 [Deltaproteobacteria bacterium]|nr:hypothetical protein [Deltaproteobacteria bacterium]
MRISLALCSLASILVACDGGGSGEANPDAPGTPGGWQPLVTKGWTLPPGGEDTSNLQVETISEDIVIGGIRPIAPSGTHHTLLFKGASGTNIIYASGVGTNELMFPPGTGMRIPAGTLIGLQLHIFNPSDQMLTGTSGIEFLPVEAASVTEEVDMFLPGPEDLALEPMKSTTKSGTCTVKTPYKVFAMIPHMHQLGTHMKTTLSVGGQPRVLNDAPYSFDHQTVLAFAPIQLNVGDTITNECTWHNPGSTTVGYGESSTTEMCYALMYRFPRGNDEFCED